MRRALLSLGGVVAFVAVAIVGWKRSRTSVPVAPSSGSRPAPPRERVDPTYVGSTACASCHPVAYAVWKGSQHAHAMQHATDATVLGNFGSAKFRHGGIESTFFRRDGKFTVRTDGPDGRLADFEIKYTFGLAPLQQYLIELPGGRVQALSIAWDSRPKNKGGQRWFHLYPRERVDYKDELHWTRRSQSWNFMCADCHSTDVRKRYDATTGGYRTSFSEISIGCEACHGPGSQHLAWSATKPTDANRGLTVSFAERAGAHWTINVTTGNAARSRPRPDDTELEVCAQCHARRGQIAEGYHAGLPFQDFYRPALLSAGLYHADGQQRDEVYTWGSFLQSRMHHAGVTCGDCHEPHAGKLRADGNAVCGSCHLSTKYDASTHHHHAGEGPGTRCVDCHMPPTTYMVIDPRHDHSLRRPRPDLSVAIGTPNACNDCHRDKDSKWAAGIVERWPVHPQDGFQRHAEAFAFAALGAAEAGPSLVWVARDGAQSPIARATALEALAAIPARAALEAARAGLFDRDALVRRAGVAALAALPPAQRLALLAPRLDDAIRTVRSEAVNALADAIQDATPVERAAFDRAAMEYEATEDYNSDRPEARTARGGFYARQGRFAEAETQLRGALALEPTWVPAVVNLADLTRAEGRDADAARVLREGLQRVPLAAALQHALGLTLIRLKQTEPALAAFARAVDLDPANPRFAYVHAIALNSAGKTAATLRALDRALARHPDDHELLVAAVTVRRDSGDVAGALKQAQRLAARYPDDAAANQLLRELGSGR